MESILYNGVDRVDNARPYGLDNLVSCCKLCNAMKSGLTVDEYLEHVVRVHAHLTASGVLELPGGSGAT